MHELENKKSDKHHPMIITDQDLLNVYFACENKKVEVLFFCLQIFLIWFQVSDVFDCMHDYGSMCRETREKYLCDRSDCVCDGYILPGYDKWGKFKLYFKKVHYVTIKSLRWKEIYSIL